MGNLTKLQLKALSESYSQVDSFDDHSIYQTIYDTLEKNGVDDKIRRDVLMEYGSAMRNQREKLDNSKQWIVSIMEDSKTNNT